MARPHLELTTAIADWYDDHARELPWRGEGVEPWAVMVSEFMLQQTPVARVIPAFERWMERWPSPASLAADSPGEAVRMWGKLGYPRRALRLHAAASEIATSFGGVVPRTVEALRSLPGVGDYTAAAVAVFGYGERAPVVDTNVRRVLHRAVLGAAEAGPSTTKTDMALCESLLPDRPLDAARLSIALMELGALVCTATAPACSSCPVTGACGWLAAGRPEYAGPPKRVQRYAGTDRQVRGKLLDVLRDADEPVGKERLDIVWSDDTQRERALAGLLDDGLATQTSDGRFALPA